MKQAVVSVVSVFGRGHSLAAQLQQAGIPTTLIDLSSSMGVWSPEEAEGPFGFFKSDRLTGQQLARLNADDSVVENETGLTIWIGQKLLEMKSQVTPTLCRQFGINPEEMAQGQVIKNLVEKLIEQYQSAVVPKIHDQSKRNLIRTQVPLSPLILRQVTRPGLQRSLDWLEQQGVEVLSEVKALDLSLSSRKSISALELSGKVSGLLKAEMWVWCLTSEETRCLSERISDKIFSQEVNESTWCWMKYRVSIADCRERRVLPYHWLFVKDLEAPWTHENLLIVQKTASEDLFDCWMRLPTLQRFNKDYIMSRAQDLKKTLGQKIPETMIKLHSFPQEYNYTYADLGAPRFPLYETEVSLPKMENLVFSSPETWTHYGWDNVLKSQERIATHFMGWWKKRLEREQKNKVKVVEK